MLIRKNKESRKSIRNMRRLRSKNAISIHFSERAQYALLLSLLAVICVILMTYLMLYAHFTNVIHELEKQIGSADNVFADDTNVRDFTRLSIQERVRINELKVNSYLNWANDPRFAWSKQSECKNISSLSEFDERETSKAGLYDHSICLDDFPSVDEDCLIYDFGVRKQPEFGKIFADAELFNCEVHAFDPSPVSVDWWTKLQNDPDDPNYALVTNPNYHFHPYGIGGSDGPIKLFEYNWGQVSNLAFPRALVQCGDDVSKPCNRTELDLKEYYLGVKTLPTIMADLGHQNRKIDIMKVDVEGSEYGFLMEMLDTIGCPDFIDQIAMEWHHYSIDSRYGEGSNPQINVINTMLNACGLKLFWRYTVNGWLNQNRIFDDLNMYDVRLNLASFKR